MLFTIILSILYNDFKFTNVQAHERLQRKKKSTRCTSINIFYFTYIRNMIPSCLQIGSHVVLFLLLFNEVLIISVKQYYLILISYVYIYRLHILSLCIYVDILRSNSTWKTHSFAQQTFAIISSMCNT